MARLDADKVIDVSVVAIGTHAANKNYVTTASSNLPALNSYAGLVAFPNAVYWSLRTSGFGTTQINTVAFGNNNYTLGGQTARLASSTDSVNWILRTIPTTGNISSLLNVNNLYIATLLTAGLFTSTDTIVWTLRTSGANGGGSLAFLNNIYFAGGSSGYLGVSTDTIHWTLRTTGNSGSSVSKSIVYQNNQYFYVGSSASTPLTRASSSTDTIHWTLRTIGVSSSIGLGAHVYGNGIYVAAGGSGNLFTSTDSISWSRRTSTLTTQIKTISFGNQIFIIGSANGEVRSSTDGIVWTIRTSSTEGVSSLNGSTYANSTLGNANQFLFGGDSGSLIASQSQTPTYWEKFRYNAPTSVNPISFKGSIDFPFPGTYNISVPRISTISNFYIEAIGAGAGGAQGNYSGESGAGGGSGAYNAWLVKKQNFGDAQTITVTVGSGGIGGNNRNFASSTDGISWRPQYGQSINPSNTNPAIKYILDELVLNSSGYLITTTDIVHWTMRTAGFNSGINVIGRNSTGSFFAAVGDSSRIVTSTNTVIWTLRTLGFSANLYSYTNSSNIHLTSSNLGRVFASTNAIVWSLRTTPISNSDFIQGSYSESTPSLQYLLGGESFIVHSTDSVIWNIRTGAIISQIRFIDKASGIYVSGGPTGSGSSHLSTSTDTIHWTLRTTGLFSSDYLTSFTYDSDALRFYIAARNGKLISSTDTIHWSFRTTSFGSVGSVDSFVSYFTSISGSINRLLLGANYSIPISASSGGNTQISWSPASSIQYTLVSYGGTAPGSSRYALPSPSNSLYSTGGLSGSSAVTNRAGLSTFPQNSYQPTSGASGSSAVFNGAAGSTNGGSVTTYYYGNTYVSAGGTILGSGSPGMPPTYTGGMFGSGGGGGGVYAEGPSVWKVRTLPFTATVGNQVVAIDYYVNGSYFYVFGNTTSSIAISTDTIHWSLRTSGFLSSATDYFVNFDNDYRLLTTSSSGYFYQSKTTSPISGGGPWNSVATLPGGGGRLTAIYRAPSDAFPTPPLLIGDSTGRIYTGTVSSIESGSWTLRTANFFGSLTSINSVFASRFGGGELYFAGGGSASNTPILCSSTNSIQWTLRTVGISGTTLISNIFKPGSYNGAENYFLTTTTGDLRFSTDGIIWTSAGTVGGSINPRCVTTIGGTQLATDAFSIAYAFYVNSNTQIGYSVAPFGGSALIRTISPGAGTGGAAAASFTLLGNLPIGSFNSILPETVFNERTIVMFGGQTSRSLAVSFMPGNSFAGDGGSGTIGGGGGGGGSSAALGYQSGFTIGSGGAGGDGFARISWW